MKHGETNYETVTVKQILVLLNLNQFYSLGFSSSLLVSTRVRISGSQFAICDHVSVIRELPSVLFSKIVNV